MVSYPSDPNTIKQWELPGRFFRYGSLAESQMVLSSELPSRVQDNPLVLVWESCLCLRYDYARFFSDNITSYLRDALHKITKSHVGFTAWCAFAPSRCSSVGLCGFTALPQRAQVNSTAREVCQTITASMRGCVASRASGKNWETWGMQVSQDILL